MTDRQTVTRWQTDRQIDKQIDRQIDGYTKKIDRQKER